MHQTADTKTERLLQNQRTHKNTKKSTLFSHRLREGYHIPASLEKALVYRKTTIPGIPDPSLPHCKSNNLPQRAPFTLFCSKRNKEAPKEVITLYLQNTIFCVIFVTFILLSQVSIILTNRKYACKYKYANSTGKCPWSDLEVNFMAPKDIYFIITEITDSIAYQNSLIFGLWVKLIAQLFLFILPVIFIYFEVRLRVRLRSHWLERLKQGEAQISDYSVMITSKVSKDEDKLDLEHLKKCFRVLLLEFGDLGEVEFVDYFCTTERTPLEYLRLQIDQITDQIEYTSSLLESEENFEETEKLKISKKIENFKNLKKNFQKKFEKLQKKISENSIPEDPPINQRKVDSKSVAFVTLTDLRVRNKLIRASRILRIRKNLSKTSGNPNSNFILEFQKDFKVEAAPTLDKILWKNAALSEGQRSCIRTGCNFVLLCCYFLTCRIVLLLSNWIIQLNSSQSDPERSQSGNFWLINPDRGSNRPSQASFGSNSHISQETDFGTFKPRYMSLINWLVVIGINLIFKISSFLCELIGGLSNGITKNGYNYMNMLSLGMLRVVALVFSLEKMDLGHDYSNSFLFQKLMHVVLLDSLLQCVMKLVGLSIFKKHLKIEVNTPAKRAKRMFWEAREPHRVLIHHQVLSNPLSSIFQPDDLMAANALFFGIFSHQLVRG